jgi:acetyl-CoA acyltransferase
VQAVADAAARIRLGEADVMIAGGTETMSLMNQMMGNKIAINPAIFEKDENYAIAFGMGLTAEKVAAQWKVSREDQDAFAVAVAPESLRGDRRPDISRPRSRPTRSRRMCRI